MSSAHSGDDALVILLPTSQQAMRLAQLPAESPLVKSWTIGSGLRGSGMTTPAERRSKEERSRDATHIRCSSVYRATPAVRRITRGWTGDHPWRSSGRADP